MSERRIDQEHREPDGRWRIEFTRQDDIVWSVLHGKLKEEDADTLLKLFRDWQATVGKPYPHIMDINQFEGDDAGTRMKLARALLGKDSPLASFAIVGGNFVLRTMFNLFAMTSKIPMKMFPATEDALAWVRSLP